METLYRKYITKKGKTKYKLAGFNWPNISEGVWMIQRNESGRITTSLNWLLSDIPKVDMETATLLLSKKDEISLRLLKLFTKGSEENVKAGKLFNQTPDLLGISIAELTNYMLRGLIEDVQEEMIEHRRLNIK